MKFSGSIFVYSLLLSLSGALAQEVAVPPLSFVTLQEKYNNAVVPINLERNEREVALTQGYLTALEQVHQDFMADGDPAGSAAAKAEKERVADGLETVPADVEAMPRAMQKMCREYEAGLKRIDEEQNQKLEVLREQYVRDLTKLERRLTRQGDSEGALIARGEKERMSRASMKGGAALDGLEPWTRKWELLQCWAPGNTIHREFENSWYEGDMQPGEYSNRPFCEGAGVRAGILELHPVSRREPAKLRYRGRLNSSTPTLIVEAGGCVRGDSLLRCIVNGEEVKQYVLKGESWTVCEFDLSEFVNSNPVVELWNTGGGANPWFYEHCYIDKIYFK